LDTINTGAAPVSSGPGMGDGIGAQEFEETSRCAGTPFPSDPLRWGDRSFSKVPRLDESILLSRFKKLHADE
jgi:hypothetical protein